MLILGMHDVYGVVVYNSQLHLSDVLICVFFEVFVVLSVVSYNIMPKGTWNPQQLALYVFFLF